MRSSALLVLMLAAAPLDSPSDGERKAFGSIPVAIDEPRAGERALLADARRPSLDADAALRLMIDLAPKLLAPVGRYEGRSRVRTNVFHWLYRARPSWVPFEDRHVGYYAAADAEIGDAAFAASLWARVDRSASSVARTWDLLKPRLSTLLPRAAATKAQLPETVEALLAMHGAIVAHGGPTWLKEHHKRARALERVPVCESRPSDVDPSPTPCLNDRVYGRREAHDALYTEPWVFEAGRHGLAIWAASFWVRREHEGNRAVVHDILLELQRRYPLASAAGATPASSPNTNGKKR